MSDIEDAGDILAFVSVKGPTLSDSRRISVELPSVAFGSVDRSPREHAEVVRKRHSEVGIGARVKRVRSAQKSIKRREKREKWLIERVGAQSVNADDEDMRVLGGDLLR